MFHHSIKENAVILQNLTSRLILIGTLIVRYSMDRFDKHMYAKKNIR